MTTATAAIQVESLEPKIADADMTFLKIHIVKRHSEISVNDVTKSEEAYKEYLQKCKDNRGAELVPGPEVDMMWHEHILHTKQYAKFCKDYFGYFLHHTPKVHIADTDNSTGVCSCCDGDSGE